MLPGTPYLVDMYHLTNEHNYKRILNDGRILPLSHPFWRLRFDKGRFREAFEDAGIEFRRINSLMQSNKYIVGFLEPIPLGWIKSGLMKNVLSHIQNKRSFIEFNPAKGDIYSFHMQVEIPWVFVRDHWYTSPEYFIQKYGGDFWALFLQNPSKHVFNVKIMEGLVKYFNSSIPYGDYLRRKDYKAPELWYAGDYRLNPFEGIKRLSNKGIETLKGK